MSFAIQVGAFRNKVRVNLDIVARKLAFDALLGVQLRSAVKTGRFRASWRVSVGKPDLTVEPPRDTDTEVGPGQVDSEAFARENAKIANIQVGDVIYISNNLDYGPDLEAGTLSKQVPPDGMLGATFLELKLKFEKAFGSTT